VRRRFSTQPVATDEAPLPEMSGRPVGAGKAWEEEP